MSGSKIERLSTGISEFNNTIAGGIPRGFFVAATGEPGTGKTIFCLHFIAEGIKEGDRCIYVTTEESRESILSQAAQFGLDFRKAIEDKQLIIIDALMGLEDIWSLKSLEVEELVNKIIEAKRTLGYGRARLAIDSLSAFWLDRPAMARRYSYFVKKVLAKWDFTIVATSQYAITTSLDYHEPIVLKNKDEIRIQPIGRFVENISKEDRVTDISRDGWEAVSFNHQSLKLGWKPISKVIRHRINEKLYTVEMETGRRIKTSPDHSLYVLEDCEVKAKPTRELSIGDYVLIPSKLPSLNQNKMHVINLIEEFSRHDDLSAYMYIHDVPVSIVESSKIRQLVKEKYSVGHDTCRWYWKAKKVFPLRVLQEAGISLDNVKGCRISLVQKTVATNSIKSLISIDGDFARLLGYFIAEGQFKGNSIIFTFNAKEVKCAEDVKNCINRLFGISGKIYVKNGKIDVVAYSKLIRLFFEKVLHLCTGAYNKEVPEIIFMAPLHLQMEFLKALYRGDGSYRTGKDLVYTTASTKLASDISYLLLNFGVIASLEKHGRGLNVRVSYGGGRKALSQIIQALDKATVFGKDSRFLGIPKEQILPILREISYVQEKTGTYTHLNKKRTSRQRVRNEIFEPNAFKLTIRILKSLSRGPLTVKNIAINVDESISRCRVTLKRLLERGHVLCSANRRNAKYELTNSGFKLLRKIKLLENLIQSDFGFVRVRKITSTSPTEREVYDISVNPCENFVGGLGGIICHNSDAFGFGVEHIADGILRFRRVVRKGVLRRYLLVEKMRQTPHSLVMHELTVVDGRGLIIFGPVEERRENHVLPRHITRKMLAARKSKEAEVE
jgi:KaiC domain protein